MYLGNFGSLFEQIDEPKCDHIYHMDVLNFFRQMPDQSVQMIVTSPPYYGLRDYGVDNQLGLEETPFQYVENLVAIFHEAKRVLKDDGVMFINLGDTYSSHKDCKSIPQSMHKGKSAEVAHVIDKGKSVSRDSRMLKQHGFQNKSLMMIPARVALALSDDGWILRNEIVWHKPSCMPESVKDRFTRDHEMVYLFSKSGQYYFDQEAVMVPTKANSIARAKRGRNADHKNVNGAPGQVPHTFHQFVPADNEREVDEMRNRRTVWRISPRGFKGAHFATFPPELAEICIKAGSGTGDTVCDPFMGSGTSAYVARRFNRHFIGCDLNVNYVLMARRRLDAPMQLDLFSSVA